MSGQWLMGDGGLGGTRVKGSHLRWLCNPLVLKAVIALARFGYALAHIVLRH